MEPIHRVAVVGAGNMGSGIAQKSAQEEFDVQMVDRELQWVERGQSIIADFLSEAVERRIFSPAQVESIQHRITGVVGVENTAEDTDLVIEAVFEDFDVKTAVFNALDEACGDSTILASNTSSLSVNALAEATGRADRFVGLHFFYHPAKNRLVEVIPAQSSSQETIDKVVQYCKMLGKVVIVCADRPGFVVNRFFVPWLNEACLLLEEGVANAAQIDAVLRRHLSPEARARLARIALVEPKRVQSIKADLAAMVSQGTLSTPMSDASLKQLLTQLSKSRSNASVRRI